MKVKPHMNRLLCALRFISYSLWCVSGIVVFAGSVYVLFFAPVESVDPSSMNQRVATWHKVAYLAFLMGVFAIGLVINRIVWRPLCKSPKVNADKPLRSSGNRSRAK